MTMAWAPTTKAEEKDFRSRFSSRSHSSCLASSRTNVIFTTSAGPMFTGMPGNFSQARLPPRLMPSGVRSSRMKKILKASTHFHRFISTSRSTMEKVMYVQTPSSMAANWTITSLLLSKYRVALKISTMPYSVAVQQRASSTRSACWKKSARLAFSRFSMGRLRFIKGSNFNGCSISQRAGPVNDTKLFLQIAQSMV